MSRTKAFIEWVAEQTGKDFDEVVTLLSQPAEYQNWVRKWQQHQQGGTVSQLHLVASQVAEDELELDD